MKNKRNDHTIVVSNAEKTENLTELQIEVH